MAKNVLTLFQIGRWVMVGVLLGTVLTGCFRDAGEGDAEPTQQQVNLQDIELNRTSAPSATRTPPVATFSPQTPTESGTLTIGGPPVEAAASATPKPTRTPESAEDAEDSTGDDAPPEASATATTTRTLVPTNTEVPPDVATVAPPGFGDTGISPTPSRTFTPSQEPNQPTPTDAAQQDECVYLVQGGDTLFSIARSFDLLPDDFYAVNPALQYNPDSLYIGQEIQIPNCVPEGEANTPGPEDEPAATSDGATSAPTQPPGSQTYVIQQGDTLFSIAQRYGVTVDDLVAANDWLFSEDTTLFPGNSLTIPAPTE